MKKGKKNKDEKKVNLKINKKLIIIILVIIVVGIVGYLVFNYFLDKPSYYERKMNEYSLSDNYINQQPYDEEYVTKSEAVRMAIEAVIKGNDIGIFTEIYGEEFYSNLTWVMYAYKTNLIDYGYITEENESENITCIDAIKILYRTKNRIFIPREGIEKVINDEEIVIKNKEQFSDEEIEALKDMISYGILDNDYKYSKDKELTKKIFNEIIVKFYEKYIQKMS